MQYHQDILAERLVRLPFQVRTSKDRYAKKNLKIVSAELKAKERKTVSNLTQNNDQL